MIPSFVVVSIQKFLSIFRQYLCVCVCVFGGLCGCATSIIIIENIKNYYYYYY